MPSLPVYEKTMRELNIANSGKRSGYYNNYVGEEKRCSLLRSERTGVPEENYITKIKFTDMTTLRNPEWLHSPF